MAMSFSLDEPTKQWLKNDTDKFYFACENDDIDWVMQYLRKNNWGKGSREIVQGAFLATNAGARLTLAYLLQFLDGSETDDDGWTLLHIATNGGFGKVTNQLIKAKLDYNARDHKGWTPLAFACFSGNVSIVRSLLEKPKISLNFGKEELSCVMLCVHNGHADCVKVVLEHYSKKFPSELEKILSQRASQHGPALVHLAAVHDNANITAYLLQKGANPNLFYDSESALHIAAQFGNAEVCRALIESGSALEAKDKNGETPLDKALDRNRIGASSVLVELGAEVHKVLESIHKEELRMAVQMASVNRAVIGQLSAGGGATSIKLAKLALKEIPNSLKVSQYCGNVTELNLSQNLLESLEGIGSLANLKVLNVSNNRLVDFPEELCSLKYLEELYASDNQITELPQYIGRCNSLKDVYLSSNKISTIPDSMTQLSCLSFLDLKKNNVNNVPPGLGLLENFKICVLENPLRELAIAREVTMRKDIDEHSSYLLTHLRQRILSGEERYFRVKLMIVGQENVGKTSLLRCFREEKEKRKLNLKKTKMRDFGGTSVATDGIDIHDWVENVEKDGEKIELTFNAWDFAGQIVYYTTHQFFLSERSIFLAVFNMTDPDLGRLAYWIKSIHVKILKPIIFLVATHLDHKDVTPELEKQVGLKINKTCAHYKNSIRGCVFVSTRTRVNIDTLRGMIVAEAMKLPHVGSVHPKSYKVLEQEVLIAKKLYDPPVMHWDSFLRLGKQCSLKESEMESVTAFLHDLGLLIHFSDKHNKQLSQLVILDPQFLTKAMASIVSLKSSMIRGGILKLEDCSHIWRPPLFPVELHESLLRILESFQVVYRMRTKKLPSASSSSVLLSQPSATPSASSATLSDFPSSSSEETLTDDGSSVLATESESLDVGQKNTQMSDLKKIQADLGGGRKYLQGTCIIPALLPEERPKELQRYWPRSKRSLVDNEISFISRIFQFTFLPLGFFSRLIVQLLHILPSICYWQSGIVLQSTDNDTRALVENFKGKKQIYVEVRGSARAKLLLVLVSEIESLIKGWFSNTEVKAQVYAVCPHCVVLRVATPHLFSMNECIEAITSQKQYLYCNGYIPVRLRDLVIDVALKDSEKIEYSELKMEKELGKGGFGMVYKCLYKGAPVAVKQLIMEGASTAKKVAMFQDFNMEAFFMSQLKHENVVQLVGLCMHPLCLVTEFVPCGDLYHLFQKNDIDFVWPFIYRICLDIAHGMRFLHGFVPPIIHRDLKSPNILMCSEGDLSVPVIAKVADFGLSSIAAATIQGGGDMFSGWQPPEVLNNEEYDESADVYSFGIIMWELITKSQPFKEYDNNFKNIMAKRKAITEGLRPTLPSPSPSLLPPSYLQLLQKCWETLPENRPTFPQILGELYEMGDGAGGGREEGGESGGSVLLLGGAARSASLPSSSSSSASPSSSSFASGLKDLRHGPHRQSRWDLTVGRKREKNNSVAITQKKTKMEAKYRKICCMAAIISVDNSKNVKKKSRTILEEPPAPQLRIWCGCEDATLLIIDINSSTERVINSTHKSPIVAILEVVPETEGGGGEGGEGGEGGSLVCTVDEKGGVGLWSKEMMVETLRVKPLNDSGPVFAVQSDNCLLVGSGRILAVVHIYGPTSVRTKEIKVPNNGIISSLCSVPVMRNSLEFIEDGIESNAWMGMTDGNIIVWDTSSFLPKAHSFVHEGSVSNLYSAADGSVVWSSCGPSLFVWAADTLDLLDELVEHTNPICSVTFALDFVVSVDVVGKVVLWDSHSLEKVQTCSLSSLSPSSCLLHLSFPFSSKQQIWVATDDQTLCVLSFSLRQPTTLLLQTPLLLSSSDSCSSFSLSSDPSSILSHRGSTPSSSSSSSYLAPPSKKRSKSPKRFSKKSEKSKNKMNTKGGKVEGGKGGEVLGNRGSQIVFGPRVCGKGALSGLVVEGAVGGKVGGLTGPYPGINFNGVVDGIQSFENIHSVANPKKFSLFYGDAGSLFDRDLKEKTRTGDPIADVYLVEKTENRVFIGIADGDLWGDKARDGARHSLLHVKKKLSKAKITSIEVAISEIEKASLGIEELLKKHGNLVTIAYGLVLKVKSWEGKSKDITPSHIFLCASIGACKAYCYSSSSGYVSEVTTIDCSRICLSESQEGSSPSITSQRNESDQMCLYSFACEENDIIFLVTDGLHRNIDPQALRSLPVTLGLPGNSWDEIYHDPDLRKMAEMIKQQFRETTLRNLINGIEGEITPQSVVKTLMEFAADVTTDKRQLHEEISMQNWVAEDKKKIVAFERQMRLRVKESRGKLDHICVVAAEV